MRIDKICKTCGFDSNGVCGMYTTCKEGEECDDWEASLEYYTEITKKAPWYIKKPYDQCKISYEKFLDLLQQDEQGVGVEINIYDAIEKVYELNSVELAGVLDSCCGRKEDGQNNRRPLPLRRIGACTIRAVIRAYRQKKRTASGNGCRPCAIMDL